MASFTLWLLVFDCFFLFFVELQIIRFVISTFMPLFFILRFTSLPPPPITGSCTMMHVGGVDGRWEFVTAGAPFHNLERALGLSKTGKLGWL